MLTLWCSGKAALEILPRPERGLGIREIIWGFHFREIIWGIFDKYFTSMLRSFNHLAVLSTSLIRINRFKGWYFFFQKIFTCSYSRADCTPETHFPSKWGNKDGQTCGNNLIGISHLLPPAVAAPRQETGGKSSGCCRRTLPSCRSTGELGDHLKIDAFEVDFFILHWVNTNSFVSY